MVLSWFGNENYKCDSTSVTGAEDTESLEEQPGAYELVGPPPVQSKPVAPPVTTTTTWLSSLVPVTKTQSYGTLHDNQSINGNPIRLDGVVYKEGLGTTAIPA